MTQNIQKLSGGRFQQADYSIGRYAAMVPVGTTIADVTHPEYWQNHLASMRPGMLVTVLSDDFALDCELRVLTVTKTTAKMRVLRHWQGEDKAAADISDAVVSYAGPHHKWRFMHGGEVIEHGFATKEEAEASAAKYVDGLKG